MPQDAVVLENMDKEMKKEAGRQFVHYFRVWFLVLAVLAVVFVMKKGMEVIGDRQTRGNSQAPVERIYDEADVLTVEEEQKLRQYIANCERTYHIDIVIWTMNQDVESQGDWDTVMTNTADDLYDKNYYGYDRVHGDGVLLLDNWYEDENGSQKGSKLSTCGRVIRLMDDYEVERVLDEVYYRVDANPYEAYKACVDKVCDIVAGSDGVVEIPSAVILLAPIIVAVGYALVHLKQSPAKDTVAPNAYVAGGKPVLQASSDDFIRKNVVTRRIESSSGGSRSGGGRSHVSSSGVRHGGGSRRR